MTDSIDYQLIKSLGDSHCHLDVSCTEDDINKLTTLFNSSDFPLNNRASYFHIMSTNHIDILLLDKLLDQLNQDLVVPYFGVHPWYSHLFSIINRDSTTDLKQFKLNHYQSVLTPSPSPEILDILPDPIDLNNHLKLIENLIQKHKLKFNYGIGEIGLDKLFRIPTNGYYGNQLHPNDGDNKLSPHKVNISHQNIVFEKQLELANKLKKQVSIHCVKAHGSLFDTIPKYTQLSSVLLHSFTGSIEQGIRWINYYKSLGEENTKLYFSFSNWINGSDNKRQLLEGLLSVLQPNQILIETDISIDRYLIGSDTDNLITTDEYFEHLIDIFKKICNIRQWNSLHEQSQTIFQNISTSII
ncbi:uncharacterized protein RJT21DRAFT_17603 [Scheffersomyces amazonensis]|uniref:uncharacterized protein n=1 Tax=Scheffersomyces amazonensis TaxID=1078765 RepID=UPI00315D2E25